MKINPTVIFLKSEAAAPALAAAKSQAADGVSAARTPAVARPARLAPASGDFNAARVAEIRESIRAGSYQVDTTRIADGLLSTVRDLIGKNPA